MELFIGLFFFMDAKTNELLSPPEMFQFQSEAECTQALGYLKVKAQESLYGSKVIGVCIDGEEIK